MPLHNLEGILSDTLLFAAQPRLSPVDSVPTPPPIDTSGYYAHRPAEHRPIWEYQKAKLNEVRNLTVIHRNMRFERVTVCDRVSWGPITLKSKRGKEYELPLSDRFLLRNYWVYDGDIDGRESPLWPLAMDIHHSFQHVFGYEVDLVSGQLNPLAKDDETLRNPELFMPIQAPAGGLAPVPLRAGSKLVCRVAPLRIVVCVSLGCATERYDFEPGGVLGAAKVFPLIMVYTNLAVEQVEATVVVERPRTSARCHIDGEQMTDRLSSVLFTDRNISPFVSFRAPLPQWDNIFDYYDVNPAAGTSFKAVRRGTGVRERADLAETLSLTGYSKRAVKKVPGQGEFDNIHIAPRMIVPNSLRKLNPAGKFDEVVMAPFCIHDCFHTHWRWGETGGATWVKGWSGTADSLGEPHQVAGAPLVPPNQDVEIKLLGDTGFEYKATAHQPRAGQWQVFMHHGSGYAIDTTFLDSVAKALTPGINATWSLFYWNLRYENNGRWSSNERIKSDPGVTAQLRAL